MKNTAEYIKNVARVADMVPGLNALNNRSVLITGGGGLICSSLVDIIFYLNEKKNAHIHVILAGRSREKLAARFEGKQEGRDYEFVYFDALSGQVPDATADFIIHGAGNATPSAYASDPVGTMCGHIIGTNAMLSLAARTAVKRFLYISSSEVYGTKNDDLPYSEDAYGYVDIRNPRAAYPSAKRAGETLCAAYREQYNVDSVTVRPGHIYGTTERPSDDRAVSQFIRCAHNGTNIVMKSAGGQMRSYCHALDCASAILAVLLCGKNGEVYNISNADSVVTIRDVAETLAKLANIQVEFETPSAKEQKGYNLMNNSSLDASKLEALGWKACIRLEDGLRCCLQQMQGDSKA